MDTHQSIEQRLADIEVLLRELLNWSPIVRLVESLNSPAQWGTDEADLAHAQRLRDAIARLRQ